MHKVKQWLKNNEDVIIAFLETRTERPKEDCLVTRTILRTLPNGCRVNEYHIIFPDEYLETAGLVIQAVTKQEVYNGGILIFDHIVELGIISDFRLMYGAIKHNPYLASDSPFGEKLIDVANEIARTLASKIGKWQIDRQETLAAKLMRHSTYGAHYTPI